ncbi:hypothetical protein AHAS_Ahas11G0116500 [Arachis hypogaea]
MLIASAEEFKTWVHDTELVDLVLNDRLFTWFRGANPRLAKTWKSMINKVEAKLSMWKAKTLNKAGRLVLIKSVFNSLPMYYLSLYKMPKSVVKKLISLQRSFLWSKEDRKTGIPLVIW